MLPTSLNLRFLVQGVVLAGLVLCICVIVTRNLLQGGGMVNTFLQPSVGILPSVGQRLEGVMTRITVHSRDLNHTTDFTTTVPLDFEDFEGVVLSMIDERYNHTKAVLEKLNFVVSRHIPPSFQSTEVISGLEKFTGTRGYHTANGFFLKVYSNRMAFADIMQSFVDDKSCDDNSWRFFFEDDIQLHPSLTPETAQIVLAKGLDVAAGDGMVYLGITGPVNCSDATTVVLFDVHLGSRCSGTGAHAFGFTKWKAVIFLASMNTVVDMIDNPPWKMYFDQMLSYHGKKVHPIWTLGVNLRSPIAEGHLGLLYQDRILFPTTIGK